MKNLRTLTRVGCAVVLAGALTGCETMTQHSDDRTAGRVVDDKNITKSVQNGLKNEEVYKFTGVDVNTYSGVVQLSGFVNTEDQKDRAGEIAKNAPNVVEVINSLTIKPTLTPTGNPSGQRTSDQK